MSKKKCTPMPGVKYTKKGGKKVYTHGESLEVDQKTFDDSKYLMELPDGTGSDDRAGEPAEVSADLPVDAEAAK